MKSRWTWLSLCMFAGPLTAGADFSVTTDSVELHFSESGALVAAAACYPRCDSGVRAAESIKRIQFGGGAGEVIGHGMTPEDWTMTPAVQGTYRVLEFEHAGGTSLTWKIPDKGYRLQLTLGGSPAAASLAVRSGTDFQPLHSAGFGRWLEQVRYVALEARQVDFDGDRAALDEDEARAWLTNNWAGFRNRYWALMVRPGEPARFQARTGEGRLDAALEVALHGKVQRFDVYVGPVEPAALAAADPALRGVLFGALWFWLRWISFALLWLLNGIHSGVAAILPPSLSWGLSIMLLSLTVHILMRPLSRTAERFQDRVHAQESRLAPELSRIRRNYRGEQQAQAVLALYRREGVHPLYSLKSLVGVAIVIPVFIGAFDMLAENIHLLGVSFLWIGDLSRPDAVGHLPFELPFFGAGINVLPFLMTGLSFLASMLHRSPAQHPDLRRKQLRNMLLLAAAFFVLFYTFPSGMVLYWTTNNLISALKGGWRHLGKPAPGAEQGEHG